MIKHGMFKAIPRSSFAYSLVEILVVVSVLVALVVMLLPIMSTGKRNAYSSVCMKNLKQLGQAHQMALLESKTNSSLGENLRYGADSWTTYLVPYLKAEEKIFVCPESGVTHASTPLNQLMFGIDNGGNNSQTIHVADADFTSINYYMELDASRPWIKKLGWEQYQALREKVEAASGQTFEQAADSVGGGAPINAAAIDYWNNHYAGFEPGEDPNRYVILMEDFRVDDGDINSLGHQNFTDFIIKVEPKEDDPTHIVVTASHLVRGSKDAGFLVWADTLESVYSPATALKMYDTRTIEIPKSLSSYGANPNQVFNQRAVDNRVLFLDYEHIVATPDNWDDWDDEVTGVPDYARHMGNMINVTYIDGSVLMTQEDKINPSIFTLEKLYW